MSWLHVARLHGVSFETTLAVWPAQPLRTQVPRSQLALHLGPSTLDGIRYTSTRKSSVQLPLCMPSAWIPKTVLAPGRQSICHTDETYASCLRAQKPRFQGGRVLKCSMHRTVQMNQTNLWRSSLPAFLANCFACLWARKLKPSSSQLSGRTVVDSQNSISFPNTKNGQRNIPDTENCRRSR